MRIDITGAKWSPKWETLQSVVRECLSADKLAFTHIDRVDEGPDYRAPGSFNIIAETHKAAMPSSIIIELHVSEMDTANPPTYLGIAEAERELGRTLNWRRSGDNWIGMDPDGVALAQVRHSVGVKP